MKLGIVGLPNVGKSSLFNALTKKGVPCDNYPFCTIDPSVGVVAVPDQRLNQLSDFSKSVKTIPAAIEFVDIAGLVKGASQGEGLGNKFLANIREVDAIAHVVRTFKDSSVIHVADKIDPKDDIDIINYELIMADLDTVNKRKNNINHEVKRGDKEALIENNVLEKLQKILESGRLAREVDFSEKEKIKIKMLNLLTTKPVLYVLNVSEASENAEIDIPGYYVKVDPIFEKGLDDLITKSYELLGLHTYFTTGEDETRAWTIKKGSTAPEAGAAIHTDFRDKFIRAEVVNWEELLDAGSFAEARARGKIRIEGKEYIVKDGDVIEFRI